jgi:hypothetical protein
VGATCAAPGEACIDSVDCNLSEFCEPTLGRCIPQTSTPTCTLKKPPASFAPEIKWSFLESTVLPGFNQAVSAPLVVDSDKDGVPEVYVTVASQGELTQSAGGVLLSLDGATGKERWAAGVDAFAAANRIESSFSPALADIDGDGVLEIVAVSSSHQLLAFDATGKLKWRSHRSDNTDFLFPSYPTFYPSTISIADMNSDGQGEVVLSGVVFDSKGMLLSGEGRELAGGPEDATYHPTSSILADVDDDGKLDVVLGNAAYGMDGKEIWKQASLSDGFPGIADFERDGKPELIVAGWSTVRVQDASTGAQLASIDLGTGFPGTPVIADLDGDGTPEIGVVSGYNGCSLVALEYDAVTGLSIRWSHAMASCSGFLTATAFDFEGDGKVEVLAHDDCYFYVLDGIKGDVLLKVAASHATWTEYVSVVDIDGDKSADLMFSTNDHWNGSPANWSACAYTGGDAARHGVFVYSDPESRWMSTRKVWNQQSYHITNIKSDGKLPLNEVASWGAQGFNNYRVSYQGPGVDNAPDLAVDLEVSTATCPKLILRARVKNVGALGVAAGVDVAFYAGKNASGTLLGESKTAKALLPGASEVVELTIASPSSSPPYDFLVVVDGATAQGSVPECNESNNTAAIGAAACAMIK